MDHLQPTQELQIYGHEQDKAKDSFTTLFNAAHWAYIDAKYE